MADISWEELAGRTIARQLPERDATAPATTSVHDAVAAMGPLQTQTARSAFLGIAARVPTLDHAAITEAYASGQIIRGSSIRGTVHTSTPAQHRLLEAATRHGQRRLWTNQLGLADDRLDPLWDEIERRTMDRWRTPDELIETLGDAIDAIDAARANDTDDAPEGADTDDPLGPGTSTTGAGGAGLVRLDRGLSRSLSFGSGALVRRPIAGGWDRQTAAEYRAVDAVVDRGPAPPDPLAELVRMHLRSHGPASRNDLAWWSGLRLGLVDEVLDRLGDVLTTRTGPDGRRYHDLCTVGDGQRPEAGIRLLPEFDAVFCAYDPSGRERFADPAVSDRLWNRKNGTVLPPVLLDGRVAGFWRMTGTSRKRPLEVTIFRGFRRPRTRELEPAVAAVAAALAIEVSAVSIVRS